MCLFSWCNHVSRNYNQVILITWLFYGFWNLTLCPVTTKQIIITFKTMISVTYHTQVFGIHTVAINIKTFPCDKYHRNPTNPTYICWNPCKGVIQQSQAFQWVMSFPFQNRERVLNRRFSTSKNSDSDIEKTGGKEYWSSGMKAQRTI